MQDKLFLAGWQAVAINSMAISSSGGLWDTCGWGELDLKYGVLRVLRMELTYSFSQTKSLSRTYKDEAHKLVYLLQSESPEPFG